MDFGKMTILAALLFVAVSIITYYQSYKLINSDRREKKSKADNLRKKLKLARATY